MCNVSVPPFLHILIKYEAELVDQPLIIYNSIIVYKLCSCVRGNFQYKNSPNYSSFFFLGFFVYLEIKNMSMLV